MSITYAVFVSGYPIKSDYTPAAPVNAGDVIVVGNTTRLAHVDIAANQQGSLSLGVGLWTFPVGANTAIPDGARVYWDATNHCITQVPAGGVNRFLGWAIGLSPDGVVQTVFVLPGGSSGLFYSATVASTAITNTTTETAFDNSVLVIPANSLKVGTVIRGRVQGIATAVHSTDTQTVKIKLGSTVIVATAAVNPTANDTFHLDFEIVVRTIGVSGTLVADGLVAFGTPGTATVKQYILASTAIDTTAAQTLEVTATASVASSSNSIRADVVDFEIVNAQ